jgi:hypothetical protein
MYATNDINWNKIDEMAAKQQSTSNVGDKKFERTIFAKFPAGMHRLRIVPVGNRLEGLPFLEVGQHSFRLPDERGQLKSQFVMCWEFLLNNLRSFESVEDKRTKSLLSWLVANNKLAPQDKELYEANGCPVCKAFQTMEARGVEKIVRNAYFMKQQFIWNVVWRFNGFSGDNKIYVWGISKKHQNHIINALQQDRKQGIFTLDTEKGYDHSWNATGGNDFSRRYDVPNFDRVSSPLNLTPDQIPFDLVEIGCNSFKPYQEAVNLLKRAGSELLASIGHTIAGDITASIPMQYGNPGAMPVPEQNIPAIFIPNSAQQTMQQHIQQIPQNFPPQPQFAPPTLNQMVPPFTPPNTPTVPVQGDRKDLGGGYYQVGATVYKPDGTVAF